MKLSLCILFSAFFFLQTAVFSAENNENAESSKKADTENKEKAEAVKGAETKNGAEAKSPAGTGKDVKKDAQKNDDDGDVAALKSWRNQACPCKKNWDRTSTSQAGKSLKSTYKVHTDKDMRSAGQRLND